jgi:hypothetical protein
VPGKLLFQGRVVIDFPVTDDALPPVSAEYRLMPPGHVHDGEPLLPQGYVFLEEDALVVGAPVGEALKHTIYR